MSDAPAMLVSVVVPASDAEATLEETLRAIAAQTYRAIEILIVDDGSGDGTAALAERFCAAEPRARLIRQRKGGVARARNAGIAEARGDYVAPCDADDLWAPEKIARQVAAALAAPEPPGFVYCWSRLIDESGLAIGFIPPFALSGDGFAALWARNVVGNGSALLIHRASILAVGGYDEGLQAEGAHGCEDILLQLRLAERFPVAVVPEFLVGYRLRSDSMSSDAERMFRSWRNAARRLDRRPPLSARRWTLGHRLLTLAEQRAYRRRPAAAAGALALALAADPRRALLYLSYRLARKVARRLRPAAAAAAVPFLDWNPRIAGPADPYALGSWQSRLDRLDSARLERLKGDNRRDRGGRAVRPGASLPAL